MVNLNLTLFVELGLFLLFLWVTAKVIFRPMLDVMDAREAKTDQDRQDARTDLEQSEALEKQYTSAIFGDRRRARERSDRAHDDAYDHFITTVDKRQKQADEEVMRVRIDASKQVEAERMHYAALVPGVAQAMAGRLGLGEDES